MHLDKWRLYIYLQIQFHTQLLPTTSIHTDTQVSVPPLAILLYYSETTHALMHSKHLRT